MSITAQSMSTRTLVRSAVLAAVASTGLIATSAAYADAPDDIFIQVDQDNEPVDTDNFVFDYIIGTHTFGTTETFDSEFGGPDYFVDITSGSSGPGAYFIEMDWTEFGVDFGVSLGEDYLSFTLQILDEGTDMPIDAESVFIHDGNGDRDEYTVMDLVVTPGTMTFVLDAGEVDDGVSEPNLVVIEWTQSEIPTPGALALLGMAGLVGTRRRRSLK